MHEDARESQQGLRRMHKGEGVCEGGRRNGKG